MRQVAPPFSASAVPSPGRAGARTAQRAVGFVPDAPVFPRSAPSAAWATSALLATSGVAVRIRYLNEQGLTAESFGSIMRARGAEVSLEGEECLPRLGVPHPRRVVLGGDYDP